MSTPWWQFGITQQHGQNGELGVDVGTPFHTAISAIFGGRVLDAGFHPWGGQVDILTTLPNGQSVIEQFLHLDTIAAALFQPNAQVSAGEDIGLSGGETLAQAANLQGAQHPVINSPGHLFSTGPHTEFGLYTGTPSARTALDPTAYLADGSTGVGNNGNGNSGQPSLWGAIIAGIFGASVTTAPGNAAASAVYNAPTDIPGAIAAFGATIQQDVANAGMILLAVVFIAFGLALLLWPAAEQAGKAAGKAAEVAAVAA